jgi:L-lactate dehydrogenase
MLIVVYLEFVCLFGPCPGQTSLDYIYGNISIVRTVIDAMRPFRSDTILLVVSNPVDLITSVVQKLSGLPKSQVLGSGTFIDSMRLRGLIADRAGVSAQGFCVFCDCLTKGVPD